MYYDHTLSKLTKTLHVLFLPTLLSPFLKYVFIQFKAMCRYVCWVHVSVHICPDVLRGQWVSKPLEAAVVSHLICTLRNQLKSAAGTLCTLNY